MELVGSVSSELVLYKMKCSGELQPPSSSLPALKQALLLSSVGQCFAIWKYSGSLAQKGLLNMHTSTALLTSEGRSDFLGINLGFVNWKLSDAIKARPINI